tara:strand:+ start:2479 stop:2763 length:285 start_codon:yes stop_codon:yes gene_type:complete
MFKWLGKLKWWKQSKSSDLVVYDYGRYLYKPVTQRALAEVMGMTQTALVALVRDSEVRLNNSPLDLTHLVLRLESGDYEIVAPSLGKVWRFFIG